MNNSMKSVEKESDSNRDAYLDKPFSDPFEGKH